MSWTHSLAGRRPDPAALISTILVTLGLLLGATVNMAWLILLAAGAFGPGLLREAGLLRDQDEFQRRAAQRAGYHAYLAGGLLLAVFAIARSWNTRALGTDFVPASLILAAVLVTYALSSLTGYWGAQRAAFRILIIFGAFWFVFAALSHAGEPAALAIELALPLGILGLAWLSRSRPRWAGAILILFSLGAAWMFVAERAGHDKSGPLFVAVLLVLPLLYAGLALARAETERR